MRRFVNFAWLISFLGFFAALTLSYAFLPEEVGIHANEIGDADEFVTKEVFFYTALVIFGVGNIICFLFIRLMDAIPASSGFYFRNTRFKASITGWFAGLVSIINLFLAFGITYISLYNTQSAYQVSQYGFLMYIAPVLFIISMVWLVYIFANRHRQLAE